MDDFLLKYLNSVGRGVDWFTSHFKETFEPIKCVWCESGAVICEDTDILDGHTIMEQRLSCEDCGKTLGYWAHGHFNPSYVKAIDRADKEETPLSGELPF